jgi:hypothetical protein
MPSPENPNPKLAYTVRVEHPSQASADRYLAWLVDGHLKAVQQGGAQSAHAVRLDPDKDGGNPAVEARYTFPSRTAFESYLQHTAPALRAEGLALFGPDSGVRFTRSTGELHPPAN